MDIMAVKEWRELYEALSPDQRQECDRINQRADALAAESRGARRRYEAHLDAMQEALDRIQSTDDANAVGNRESAGQYA